MYIDINKLDQLINDQYLNLTTTGELVQLSKLFEPTFLADLLSILKKGLSNHNSYKQKLEISVCWIDKRPLADFTKQKVIDHNGHKITKKVEVGDAAFIFSTESCYLKDGKEITQNENSVSLIFQAKRSSKKSIPNVPIGTGKSNNVSTAKELALLSKWPVFDLFKASRSKSALHSKLNIAQSGVSVLSYGWFGACPPGKVTDWKSRWMCAPANNGQKCSFSLGEVFTALINKNELSNVRVGKEFNLKTDWGNYTKKGSLDSWDILNNEILYQCRNSKLPKSIFSSECPRLVQVYEYIHLDENLGFALVNPKTSIDSASKSNTKIINYLTGADSDNSQTLQLMKNECFPVLLIALKSVEG
jgi:hypothetical protein